MKKFEIIDIAQVDGHYPKRERFIGQIGTVIEGSGLFLKSSPSFIYCKFVFDDPLLNSTHSTLVNYQGESLNCVIFYRVLLREVDEFRSQVRRALKKSALRAHR